MMWILHILAAVFFLPALFLTIPLHLILSSLERTRRATEPKTYGFFGNTSLFEQMTDPKCKKKPWVSVLLFSGIFVLSLIFMFQPV